MAALILLILGLFTAVPHLGQACRGGCGEEGWAGWWKPSGGWGGPLASLTTLDTYSWEGEAGIGLTGGTSKGRDL